MNRLFANVFVGYGDQDTHRKRSQDNVVALVLWENIEVEATSASCCRGSKCSKLVLPISPNNWTRTILIRC